MLLPCSLARSPKLSYPQVRPKEMDMLLQSAHEQKKKTDLMKRCLCCEPYQVVVAVLRKRASGAPAKRF